jgi:hypothetical protein
MSATKKTVSARDGRKGFRMNSFNAISVNLSTGEISYPSPEGFTLDMERVYRSAERFSVYCPNMEMAIRHAIHEQLSAYRGAQDLTRRAR